MPSAPNYPADLPARAAAVGLRFTTDLLGRLEAGEIRYGEASAGGWLALLDEPAVASLGALLVEIARRPVTSEVSMDVTLLVWLLAGMETGEPVTGPPVPEVCGPLAATLVELVSVESMIRAGLAEAHGPARLVNAGEDAWYTLTEAGERFVAKLERARKREEAGRN